MQFNDFLCNFPTFYSYMLQGKMQREEKQEPVNIMCKAIKKGLKKSLIQAHGNGTCNSRLYEDFFIIFIVEGVKNYPHSIYMNFFPQKLHSSAKKVSRSLSLAGLLLLLLLLVVVFAKKYIRKRRKKVHSLFCIYIACILTPPSKKQAGEHTQHVHGIFGNSSMCAYSHFRLSCCCFWSLNVTHTPRHFIFISFIPFLFN